MEYIPHNTTAKPICMEVIGLTVPAKSRFSRPLTFDELQRVHTCGVNYEGIVLEPVAMEAGASASAKATAVALEGAMAPQEDSASPRRGRKKSEGE